MFEHASRRLGLGNTATRLATCFARLFETRKWPPVYSFKAVSCNRGKQKTRPRISMLELVHSLLKLNGPEELMSRQQALCATGPICSCIWRKCIISASMQQRHTGLWVDAVPFNSDRSCCRRWSPLSSASQPCGFPSRLFQKFAARKQTYECIFDGSMRYRNSKRSTSVS